MDITIRSAVEVERQEAIARLELWKAGFSHGYRGTKRETNQGASYLSGYRAGARVIKQEQHEGEPPARIKNRRRV